MGLTLPPTFNSWTALSFISPSTIFIHFVFFRNSPQLWRTPWPSRGKPLSPTLRCVKVKPPRAHHSLKLYPLDSSKWYLSAHAPRYSSLTALGEMNSRKPRTSNSILKSENGKYRRKTGKRQSCYLLRLVGTALAVAWVISFTRRYSAGSFLGAGRLRLGSSRGTSTTSNDANALKRRRPDDGHPNPKNPTTKSNHHKHHKHHVECTPSPLETREVFPKYGCDEIDVSL